MYNLIVISFFVFLFIVILTISLSIGGVIVYIALLSISHIFSLNLNISFFSCVGLFAGLSLLSGIVTLKIKSK